MRPEPIARQSGPKTAPLLRQEVQHDASVPKELVDAFRRRNITLAAFTVLAATLLAAKVLTDALAPTVATWLTQTGESPRASKLSISARCAAPPGVAASSFGRAVA